MPGRMTAGSRPLPSLQQELALWRSGHRLVAGVDEVGRGPLAGPLVAAAVILDPDLRPDWLMELRDSKTMTGNARERLAAQVRAGALAVGVGYARVSEIDAWGLTAANQAAMVRAVAALPLRPQRLLLDGRLRLPLPQPQETLVDGDATCASIAAASIVAKVDRDDLMRRLDAVYPEYLFADHKGYATRGHLERLARYGPSDQHRRLFMPVRLAAALAEVPA